MGLLLRLFGWAWRRASDASTASDVLDFLDLKTALWGGLVGLLGMITIAATNYEWSAPTVVLAALAGSVLAAILFLLVRIILLSFKANTRQKQNPAAPSWPTISKLSGRKFTNRNPRQILTQYEGRSTQKEPLTQTFDGYWIEIEGILTEIIESGATAIIKIESEIIECTFDSQWIGFVKDFEIGDSIKVRGIIRHITNSSRLHLFECELMARKENSNLHLEYPSAANLDGTESLFKRSWMPIAKEGNFDRKLSIHKLYVAVDNKSNNKTLRGVRVVMESLERLPSQVLNLPCICDRTQTEICDIPPGGTDYFLIGEGADNTDSGMFHSKWLSAEDYVLLLSQIDAQSYLGFALHSTLNRKIPLLKNDDYILHVTAYADDTFPFRAKLTINTKTRIDMFLESRYA